MLEITKIKQIGLMEKKYRLVIESDDKKILESIQKDIVTDCTQCEICYGQVTQSDGQYLCLGGCGHVTGIINGKVNT